MYPTILTIGNFPISSFGLFLILALFGGAFTVWRIIRIYELNEEKIIDLTLLTFAFGLIFARLFYFLLNYDQFLNLTRIFLINRYPGLSFWGGLFGGILALKIFTKKLKLHFWQIADYAMVGFLLGNVISSLGCLLGGCGYGMPSNLPIAVSQVGQIGKRFPIQAVEALIFFVFFLILWKAVLRFHYHGKIASLGIIYVGLIKLILDFFKEVKIEEHILNYTVNLNLFFSLILIVIGFRLNYKLGKRKFSDDLFTVKDLVVSNDKRKGVASSWRKAFYNSFVSFKVKVIRLKKNTFKLLHIRKNPTDF